MSPMTLLKSLVSLIAGSTSMCVYACTTRVQKQKQAVKLPELKQIMTRSTQLKGTGINRKTQAYTSYVYSWS
ncbi:hypothetical protein BJV74DRAFT_828823 [Russula compacta]|nr:hypothetical protein BJV74DRAFT_828823 [Russula compacta]